MAVSNDTTVLRADTVTKQFIQGATKLDVLKGISVSFHQGMTYAITGSSGTGKSTLLHLIGGIDTPTSGALYCNDRNVTTMSAQQRMQFLTREVGLVFQFPYLIREFSVLENVMMKGLLSGLDYDTGEDAAFQLLKKVGLEDKAHSKPSTLSGGQQQRVAILRALYNKPAFLLADEPTGNLDEKTGKELVDFLIDCQVQWKMGIIISTHDTYVAARMQKKFQLHNGLLEEKA
jgi:lipoprotein-releasing system ATP-binding protein